MSDLSSVAWKALLSIAGGGGGEEAEWPPKIPQGPGSKEAARSPNPGGQHLSTWNVRISLRSKRVGSGGRAPPKASGLTMELGWRGSQTWICPRTPRASVSPRRVDGGPQ